MGWIKGHKILSAIVIVLILGIIGAAAGGSSSSKTQSSSQASSHTEAAKNVMPKIGQAARDGKFEFIINKQTCGETSVGDQYLNKAAQGQYCILNVAVKNIGNEAQMFDASNQYVYNSKSQKYSADGTASLYDNNNNQTFLNDINPGNSATGNVVFDVPQGVTPITAELHDSSFSGGVKVSLQ